MLLGSRKLSDVRTVIQHQPQDRFAQTGLGEDDENRWGIPRQQWACDL